MRRSLANEVGCIVFELYSTSRNFRRYFLGQSLSGFGDSIVPVALAFAFALVGGVVGDRFPRRRVMLVADIVRMLAHGATALALLAHRAELWQLVLLQLVGGMAAVFFDPAATGLVRDIVATDRITQANALLGFSRNALALGGIAASGVLVATVGSGWAFAINAASFGASAWFLARLELPNLGTVALDSTFMRQLVDGFTFVRSQPWLAVTIAYFALFNGVVIAPLMVVGPLVARGRLGGATSWAVLLGALAIGSTLASGASSKAKLQRPLAFGFAVIFGALPFCALLAIAAPVWLIAPAAFLFGVQSSFSNVVILSVIQKRVPTNAIARVSSYRQLGSLVLAPMGFALAGLAADRYGPSSVLWCAVIWTLASTSFVLALPMVRRMRDPVEGLSACGISEPA